MQYEAGDVARWQRCRKLFSALVQRVQQQAFDDAYLLMLIEFKAVASDAVEPALFYALYAWAHGNAAVAREYAERAYHARKINRTLWLLLRDIYLRGGGQYARIGVRGLCQRLLQGAAHALPAADRAPRGSAAALIEPEL